MLPTASTAVPEEARRPTRVRTAPASAVGFDVPDFADAGTGGLGAAGFTEADTEVAAGSAGGRCAGGTVRRVPVCKVLVRRVLVCALPSFTAGFFS